MAKKQPLALLIRGVPAAGKTTIAHHLHDILPHSAHVNIDSFKRMISRKSTAERRIISHKIAREFITLLAEKKYTLIIDEILRTSDFTVINKILTKYNYRVVSFFITADTKTLITRNKKRDKKIALKTIYWFAKHLQPRKEDIVVNNNAHHYAQTLSFILTTAGIKTRKKKRSPESELSLARS